MSVLSQPSILLTNDDGVDAEGLEVLRQSLLGLGEITVVAPREHMSASSHSISLYQPVRYDQIGPGRFAVHGTPVDSVILALNRILSRPPDLVVSGINQGGNLGQNVFYSGTVAAAVEGTFHGIPSVAVSLAALKGASFATAGEFMRRLVPALLEHGLPPLVTLNINVPYGRKPRGVRLTHRAFRDARSYLLEPDNGHRGPAYWIREKIAMEKVGEASDHAAIRQGYISITPLMLDAATPPSLGGLEEWIANFPPLASR
ncbi:MAG TPA: 5'/3'-nucleotidase SurE [Terriglobia bacterium]|nr:5'/3'-nucleotidase SurE [Terriglobia bacterium]